jgi:hypothetical protein
MEDEGDGGESAPWSGETIALLLVLCVVLTIFALGGMLFSFADAAVWILLSWAGMVITALCVPRSPRRSAKRLAAWTVLALAAIPTLLYAGAFILISVKGFSPW